MPKQCRGYIDRNEDAKVEYEVIYQAARDAGIDTTLILIILIILSLLSCTGILALLMRKLFKGMETRAIKRQEEISVDNYERQMLRGLAHDRIVHLARSYIRRGWITIEEYENLDKYLVLPYKELGFNGKIDHIMEKVREIPIRECEYTK